MQTPQTPSRTSPAPNNLQAIAATLQQAFAEHRAGRLAEAELLYRDVLCADPRQPDAHYNLGVLAFVAGKAQVALPHFKAALEANPQQAQYWLSVIETLMNVGQIGAARQMLQQALSLGLNGEPAEQLKARLGVGQTVPAALPIATHRKNAKKPPKGNKLSRPGRGKPSPQEESELFALFNNGRHAELEARCHALLERHPQSGVVWKTLGFALLEQGKDALEAAQHAARHLPEDAEVHNILGNILSDLGRHAEGAASLRRALALEPNFHEAHSNLGKVLSKLGLLTEAEASLRHALALKPDYPKALNNLGMLLSDLGRHTEAEASLRQALALKPDFPEALSNLGSVLCDLGRHAEAEASLRHALALNPDNPEALSNLGNVLSELGNHEEAEGSYRQALTLMPDYPEAHSNLLFIQNYSIRNSFEQRLADAQHYGALVTRKAAGAPPPPRCIGTPQSLRVGLVSGDLRHHAVGFFLENVLACIDRRRVELVAYPTQPKTDELSARLRSACVAWTSLYGLSDAAAAAQIRADGIHVLIDLAGHTSHNRLPLFAWKPAPVQAAWIGYLATTGVAQMDYVLGDPHATPLAEDHHFVERIWRLPECYSCFTPPATAPEVTPLPALVNGYVTFGCFNNFAKVNNTVITLWAQLLRALPEARLILKARQLANEKRRQGCFAQFEAQGIAAERVILESYSPGHAEFLAAYHRVDIALDPFPYTGCTTSCESLWMGVPVLTLRGSNFLSHAGESIAHNTGQADWIAADAAEYIAKAVHFAGDLSRLATLRASLRAQLVQSPLLDAPRFARHLEDALWGMWQAQQAKEGMVPRTPPATPTGVA
jgi:protein O-GlcNAc transferase